MKFIYNFVTLDKKCLQSKSSCSRVDLSVLAVSCHVEIIIIHFGYLITEKLQTKLGNNAKSSSFML